MTNSREKFEESIRKRFPRSDDGLLVRRLDGQYQKDHVQFQFEAWLAGRESMRDEASDLLKPKRQRSCDCDVCDCGNRGNLADVTSWDSDMFASNTVRSIEP